MVPEKIELFSGLRLTNGDDGVYFFLMRFKNCEVNEVAVRGLKENLQKRLSLGLTNRKRVLNCVSRFRLVLMDGVESGAPEKFEKSSKMDLTNKNLVLYFTSCA